MAYLISKLLYFPIFNILIKSIKGTENIPDRASFILISNHEKLIDPLYILYPILKKLNKKIHFLSSAKWWFLGETICRQWAGTIPLFNSEQAYREAKQLIEKGEIVGIFPEGGIGRTTNPKTGAIRLALETKVPILPIAIKSSYIPFASVISIGKLFHAKNKSNIKKQARDLMTYVYKLRDEI